MTVKPRGNPPLIICRHGTLPGIGDKHPDRPARNVNNQQHQHIGPAWAGVWGCGMHFIDWCAGLMPWGNTPRDDRDHPRTEIATEVTLVCAGYKLSGCHARNISHRGVFLETFTDRLPPVGTPVALNFHIWTGHVHIARQVDAQVARTDGRGLALSFDENDLGVGAVVDDVIHYLDYERRMCPRGLLQDHHSDDIAA